jgi:hypothetical protein
MDCVPTKFHSAQAKAEFGNLLLAFIADYCPESRFTNKLYDRLSNCFGHIAHYDRVGFISEYFCSPSNKLRFLTDTMSHHCMGDRHYTFSDVEWLIVKRLQQHNFASLFRKLAHKSTEAEEVLELARLSKKYGRFSPPIHQPPPSQSATGDLFAAR